jgi:pectate lyase
VRRGRIMTFRSSLCPALVATLVVTACSSATTPPLPDGGASTGGTSTSGAGGTGASSPCGVPPDVAGAAGEGSALVIQEDELGFSGVDGVVVPRQASPNVTGFSGCGFLDGDSGVGKSMSWSVRAETSGSRTLVWRYAFGGTETNLRDARLLVNGEVALDTLAFAYTGSWNDWRNTPAVDIEFAEGPNLLRLEAIGPSGLANVDFLRIDGDGVEPATPSFTVTVDANDPTAGTVSFEPEAPYFEEGASVTLRAVASPGYFFQSWTGDVTSADPDFTFPIARNTHVTARFLPEGTVEVEGVTGYATIQDDEGTPYLLTGGSLGETVTATSLEELRSYLARPEPLVVTFDGTFTGAELIQIGSDKTLLGGAGAHLQGIGLQVNGSRNVIIRNIAVSHVVAEGSGEANDAIELTGGAKNIWIDHSELYSDRLRGPDYYDGLLELKNEASFVTVSWSNFHDHYKVSLISSGDQQIGDGAIRATYHHNYFHDVGSRLPSIRFGKAHVFDNYFQNVESSGVNSRMGAVVKVEHNYFEGVKDPIVSLDSAEVGTWDVTNNLFDGCTGAQPTTSNGSLTPPYAYTLDPPEEVPALVTAGAGTGKL